jgi:uncharacterized RDD family membrane protein YckC
MTDATAAAAIYRYGGFWIRVIAYLIDAVVLGLAFGLVGAFTGIDFFDANPERFDGTGYGLNLVGSWLYEAVLTSTARGATLGKMAVGLRVVTDQGQRLSFARASGRFFAKFVSAIILLIGFLMVAFTDRKRGLHDMIAGTLVVQV